MDDLLNREYNGWENRFTWVVHLHLSDEQVLSLEIAQVVAGEPNDGPAGRLVEMWVKSSISNWMNRFPGRNTYHDHSLYLLVWDLLGSALSSTEWDALVALLTGGEVVCNGFTMTLSQCIQQSQFLHARMSRLLSEHLWLDCLGACGKGVSTRVLDQWQASYAARQCVNQSVVCVMLLTFSRELW